MRNCPECGAFYLPNTLFCESCGMALSTSQNQPTPVPSKAGPDSDLLRAMACEITSTGRHIELLLSAAALVIGRSDRQAGILPSLDLAGDGGMENGVSRQHARLLVKEGHILVEDLHSANGTWVNDKRLPPDQPFTLHRGDLVRLGRLLIRVTSISERRPLHD
jgi:hypothetical protein